MFQENKRSLIFLLLITWILLSCKAFSILPTSEPQNFPSTETVSLTET
jgi:hypothetical protein